MADEHTYGFSKDDAEALAQSIGASEAIFPEMRARGVTPDKRVVLTEALTAPTSSSVAPTECVVAVLERDSSTNILTVTDTRITTYNYTEGNTAAKGTYALIRFIGVWEIYWLACGVTAAWESVSKIPEPPPE
jgi:hypothetical protein